MTVSTSTSKSGPYAGSGTTGPFTVGFRFLEDSHLRVIRTSTDGIEKYLVLDTDYSVAGAGGASGSVTLAGVLASGEKLTILRNVPPTQEADYVQGDAFPAESHEMALDKLTMLVQQIDERSQRALRLPASDPSSLSTKLPTLSLRAGNLLGFDADGNPQAVAPAAQSATALQALLAQPAGSDQIGHIAYGAGAAATTVGDKLRESVSVLDFGADATGATDSTAAFLAAGAGALVPAGEYDIDTSTVDLSLYHGPGIITHAGQRISLTGSGLQPRLVQKQVMELELGFDNGTTDTQVFPGARLAPQGLAYVEVDGVEKFFLVQKVAGTSYTAEEKQRIVEFSADSGTPVAWSQEMQIGHGQDLTALYEDGDVWLYTSHPTETVALTSTGYDIYLCAGQSNMVGYGPGITGADTTSALVDQYAMSGPNAGLVVQAVDPLSYPDPQPDTVSPASQFARDMISSLSGDRKILLLPVAVGATTLVYGDRKWAPGGSLFEQAIVTANVALALSPNNRLAGMLISEGETDRFQTGITSNQYRNAMTSMLTSMRDRLGVQFPIVISGLNPDYNAGTEQPAWDQIQLGLAAVPALLTNSAYIAGPAGYSVPGDEIHFTAAGNRLRGTSFATSMKTLTAPPITLAGLHAGKGISKIRWRGALTDQTDVTGYQLLGQIGSGHPLAIYRKATPCVSNDGRSIVLICHESEATTADPEGSDDNSRSVLVFDRLEVEAAADPLTVQPTRIFRVPRPQPTLTEEHVTQGVAADARYIYTLGGYYQPRGWQVFSIFDYSGNLIRRIAVPGVRSEYGLDGLLDHPTLGAPTGMEVEGMTLRGEDIFWVTTDVWRAGANIVTFEGANFACIVDNTSHPPYEFRYWTPTAKAATHGTWNYGTLYSAGTNFTRRTKRIYKLLAPTGAAGEQVLDAGAYSLSPGAALYGGQNTVDLAFQRGQALRMAAYDAQSGTYRSALGHHAQRRLQVHDHRTGSNASKYVALQKGSEPGRDYAVLFATNASYTGGAHISLYGSDDTSFPGDIRFGSASMSARFIFSAAGAIRCGETDAQDIGTTNTKWRTLNANSWRFGATTLTPIITGGIGTPEGVITASVGSFFFRQNGGVGTRLYCKTSGSGNTGWTAIL